MSDVVETAAETPTEGAEIVPNDLNAETVVETPEKPNFAPITSQEDLDKMIGKRLAKEREKYSDYDDVKAQAEKFKEWEDSQKDEQTKLVEERDRLLAELETVRTEAKTHELNALRNEIATDKGLTAKQAKRLTGETREELEADADDLLDSFPVTKPASRSTSTRPIPTGTSNPEKESETKSFDAAKKADEIWARSH